MSDTAEGARERSGCALALGVLLILTGALFLARNLDLVGWSSLRFLRSAALWFADYWPLVLVVWGIFKVVRRFTAPERARVSALEVVALLFVVGLGLTLRAAREVTERLASDRSFEPWYELVDLELGPPQIFTEENSFELPPTATALAVENGEGAVVISASDEARIEVVLTKRVRGRSERDAAPIAEAVGLDFEAGSERARLVVRNPQTGRRAETDLKLVVPRRLSLALTNRRGPVSVTGLSGSVDVETSHGDVELRDLGGGLRAQTHRARLRVENVDGNVDLRNRHGAIDLRDVDGDVTATTSHSLLAARDVRGAARLDNRHASIRAERIGGTVEATGVYSDVSVEKVSGDVQIRTAHEPVFVREVSGRVVVSARNASIQILDAGGDVEVEGFGEPVTIARAAGAVRVTSRPSEVTVDEARGPVSVEGADARVRVTSFASDLSVRSSHARVSAATGSLGGNVDLESTYGDVELALPSDGSARIVATTRDGDLRTVIAGLELREASEGRRRTWEGTLGSGSHRVSLATTHGDVLLRERQR